MAKKIPSYLKLHADAAPERERDGSLQWSGLADLQADFESATGCAVNCRDEDEQGVRVAVAEKAGGKRKASARRLAGALESLIGELHQTQRALRQREAELAAGVPVATRPDEAAHLAARLEAILQGGAESIGCQAAALYLLDEATSQLKLRSCWGLPASKLLEAPRPLRGAAADLEALVGHSVALEDAAALPHWRTPEEFASAVCTPVSTPHTPLGTLWMFGAERREFSEGDRAVAEIVAGRIAAELEREMLLEEGLRSKRRDQALRRAGQWQHARRPNIAPPLDQWRLAGESEAAAAVSGEFHDWSILPDGNLALCVGAAHHTGVEAGLMAAAVHGALKAHAAYRHDAQQLVERTNDTLWTTSPGDQFASLVYAVAEPETGVLHVAGAGRCRGYLLRGSARKRITHDGPPLGVDPEMVYPQRRVKTEPGDVVVLLGAGVFAGEPREAKERERALLTAASRASGKSPERIVAALHNVLAGHSAHDRTVLALKRSE